MRKQSRRRNAVFESIEPRILFSTNLYVDAHAPGTTQDGASWDTAFLDLQHALSAAMSGMEIHVADGTYLPSETKDVSASFQLKNGVKLKGGYGGFGAASPDAIDIVANHSLLSGQLGNNVNSKIIVLANGNDSTALIDGFYISYGGNNALKVMSGSPSISNCAFTVDGNSAARAGAMYIDSATPTIKTCTFQSNGGAIYAQNCGKFPISGCTFSYNASDASGAAINALHSTLSVSQCSFQNNQSFGDGNTILADDSSIQIASCVFVQSLTYGAMVSGSRSSLNISNCTFYSTYSSPAILVAGNSYLSLYNSILWSNQSVSSMVSIDSTSSGVVSYNDIQGGWTGSGSGNINVDPKFVNPGQFSSPLDFQLPDSSPCVDAGSDGLVSTSLDYLGNNRKSNLIGIGGTQAVDMGAFEIQSPTIIGIQTFIYTVSPRTLSISFTADLLESSISADDLILNNLTTGATFDCGAISSVVYIPATKTAIWTFTSMIPDGNYTATMPTGSVSGVIANELFIGRPFSFFVLAGDANRDRVVDIKDLKALAQNWQLSNRAFGQGDFNYDHVVNAADLGILATNWQKTLPPPVAVAPAILQIGRSPARTATRVIDLL